MDYYSGGPDDPDPDGLLLRRPGLPGPGWTTTQTARSTRTRMNYYSGGPDYPDPDGLLLRRPGPPGPGWTITQAARTTRTRMDYYSGGPDYPDPDELLLRRPILPGPGWTYTQTARTTRTRMDYYSDGPVYPGKDGLILRRPGLLAHTRQDDRRSVIDEHDIKIAFSPGTLIGRLPHICLASVSQVRSHFAMMGPSSSGRSVAGPQILSHRYPGIVCRYA